MTASATQLQSDNPFLSIRLPLSALCCINSINAESTIKPEHTPWLTRVETLQEKNPAANSQKPVSRYHLVFPGSGFMRVAVKVDEAAPSITQELIDRAGGMVRVSIEGFISGAFETDGGGARPYFKASRITPIQAASSSK